MGRSKQLRARNEIKELREENRQLVARLSQLALTRITEAAKPGEHKQFNGDAGSFADF